MEKKMKIGFIDLSIDEWHANNYPAWFRSSPRAAEIELGYAWEKTPNPAGKALGDWCREYGMTPAASLEEVVERSDALCVLAPSNPEVHEELAELPLKSGKPVYVDKPFAPSKAAAKRMFALAEKHGTPLMSSSALRFGEELMAAKKRLREEAGKIVSAVTTGGGKTFEEYGIHQLEMVVSCLGTGAKRVMSCSRTEPNLHLMIDYGGERFGMAYYHPALPFSAALGTNAFLVSEQTRVEKRMFENLIAEMTEFFFSGTSPIPQDETIEIAALLEAGVSASGKPFEWIQV